MNSGRDIWYVFENQPVMEVSRVICTNCRIFAGTFKELNSIVLNVRSRVVMICRYECFRGGNYNTSIVSTTLSNRCLKTLATYQPDRILIR